MQFKNPSKLTFLFYVKAVNANIQRNIRYWVMPMQLIHQRKSHERTLFLHLNHLIAWRLRISFRQFGTLFIGIFLSNLDSRHLMTSPRTLFGQFWHMSIFGDSRAIWVICQNWVPSENQFFLDEGVTSLP